jgi:hypothetical protein
VRRKEVTPRVVFLTLLAKEVAKNWQNLQIVFIMLPNFGKLVDLPGLPIPAPLIMYLNQDPKCLGL